MIDQNNKLFTVIVLCYNNGQYLLNCIRSILMQDYPEIEIIINDDCSIDDPFKNIIERINVLKKSNINNILLLRNDKNIGTVKSINNAISKCKGNYIKLIGADDELADVDVLSKASKHLESNQIISSLVLKCDKQLQNGTLYKKYEKYNNYTNIEQYKRLCFHNYIISPSVFFTKDFYIKYGPFDERYVLLEDWPMWLRITRDGIKIEIKDFISVKYRTNVGLGTGTNKQYLNDKYNTYIYEIKPYKSILGIWFFMSSISFYIINNMFIRNVYGRIVRK